MHLDIIPALAGKGNAIHFLLNYLNLSSQRVIVAGDSGNDRSMFAAFPRGIVVANAQPELLQLRATASPDHYFAREKFAAGVSEGLCHFDVF
jgi:hydroxymethylpyrimidine pyrophosphatase-like HAD family hydrolase